MDLVNRLREVRSTIPPCMPPLWAPEGHTQTILGFILPSGTVKEKGEEVLIDLAPGEKLHSIYLKGERPITVYLFHGLGGHAEGPYMNRSARLARELGYHVFMINHRGCGKGSGLATEPYHSGRAEDLSAVIAYGRQRLPGHFHVGIGFSLSANALLLLAAGQRAQVLPDMAITVNAPIVLEKAATQLGEGLNRIYSFKFLNEMHRYVKANNPSGHDRMKRARNFLTFDSVYTSYFGGFDSGKHYYETCSAYQYLKDLKIPTVVISALDDPFVDGKDYESATYSQKAIVHLEKYGGHVGYLTAKGMGFDRWLDMALKKYLSVL